MPRDGYGPETPVWPPARIERAVETATAHDLL